MKISDLLYVQLLTRRFRVSPEMYFNGCESIGLKCSARRGVSEPNVHKPHTESARQWPASHDMRELESTDREQEMWRIRTGGWC